MAGVNVPAIVGAAQVVQRPGGDESLRQARGPIELMTDAARVAARDSGMPGILGQVGWIGVARGLWTHRNPAQLVGDRLGCRSPATALSSLSGSSPTELLGRATALIAAGQLDVALILGGEARWSYRSLKKLGLPVPWCTDPGAGEPERLSSFPSEIVEEATFLGGFPVAYALIEDRLRATSGRSVPDHRAFVAGLWSAFSEVAEANPIAWDRTRWNAEAIARESPANRMVAHPYNKAHVANNYVDMASAVIVARANIGVARDRLVFPHAIVSSHDTWRLEARDELDGAPALAAVGRRAMQLAGVGPDEIDHIDLYSCFPSMVQLTARELDLSLDRPLTVTGGLGFAGAPLANAAGHALAAMTHRVRHGGWGLVQGNGGAATKHVITLLSPDPPEAPVVEELRAVDRRERQALPPGWSGRAQIEAATVESQRDGSVRTVAAVRHGGRRGWVTTDAEDIRDAVTSAGIVAAEVDVSPDGGFTLHNLP